MVSNASDILNLDTSTKQYWVYMDNHQFNHLEQKCIKDYSNYHYKRVKDYLCKIPNHIKIMINNKLYNDKNIIIYNMLNQYLVKDCNQSIMVILLTCYQDDLTAYHNIPIKSEEIKSNTSNILLNGMCL